MSQQRADLRKQLRERRQRLGAEAQAQAGKQLLETIRKENIIDGSQHIALYLANDGEIDPAPLVQWLWRQGIQCYLPVLHPEAKNRLLFFAYDNSTPLKTNRFGIHEPVISEHAQPMAPEKLDLVFMPLTGFDEQGQRLGMGGGFYDRTFEFTSKSGKPRLIGLAHECQKVDDTLPSSWDIPMQGVVTDQRFYSC